MISLTGSFVIDTTAGTDEECTITIQDHPFKNNDVVKLKFIDVGKKLEAFEDNYLINVTGTNKVGLKNFPDESIDKKGRQTTWEWEETPEVLAALERLHNDIKEEKSND